MAKKSSRAQDPAALISALVGELLMLLSESAEYHQDSSVKGMLQQAVRSLVTIHRRLQLAERRYVVAVVGLTNVGKSTLLNALLGADLAPRRNGPCTSAPIEFVQGPDLRVTAYHRDAVTRRGLYCESSEILHERLAELAD